MNEPLIAQPLRIAVLADFESLHARRWLDVFVARGHDVSAISYYRPKADLPGVRVVPLVEADAPSDAQAPGGASGAARASSLLPRSLLRVVHASRYRKAGLREALEYLRPDVFHAHYLTEHGFYGGFSGFHPYVVSAWGSDVFRDTSSPAGKRLARWALGRADFATANDVAMAECLVQMGKRPDHIDVVRIGVERLYLDAKSANLEAEGSTPPTVISDRALEPLYNIDRVIQAFARLRENLPDARLLIAGDGSRRVQLQTMARDLGLNESVRFLGRLDPVALRDALASAHVYVSVPSSDSMAVSTLEAMAVGAFPVVADLPSNEGWIADHSNALVVPPAPAREVLSSVLYEALTNRRLRVNAIASNRAHVEAEGLHEDNMLRMEKHYYRLAGYVDGSGYAI